MSFHDAVKIALLLGSDTVVLQHRDKDAPTNPGMYTFFGGSIENGEDGRTAAARELREETSLVFDDDALRVIAAYPREGGGVMSVFTLLLSSDEFDVYEGAGKFVMSLQNVLANPLVTEGTKIAARHIIETRKEIVHVSAN